MLFASTFFGDFAFGLFLFILCVVYLGKKVAASNGPVSSAAKDYAKQKAVGFFTRFLK